MAIVNNEQPADWPSNVPFFGLSDRETFTYKLNPKYRDRVIAGWTDKQMEMGIDVSEIVKNVVYLHILANSQPAGSIPTEEARTQAQAKPRTDQSAIDALMDMED